MKKVLVIEDNHDMRENIAEILELDGYDVLQAGDGKAGVRHAKAHHPDLIICDIMMPELDGYGVLHILSRNPETASIPFMFLTAKADKSDIRKGMNLGADDYLTKPFEDTELLGAVESRLKKHTALHAEFDGGSQGLNQFLDAAKNTSDLKLASISDKSRTFKVGESVYYEGDSSLYLYLVNKGQIMCSKMDDYGKELVTNIYGPGDYFGYAELFEESERHESAKAKEDSDLTLISRDDFLSIMGQNRDVAIRFIRVMANHIQDKEEKLLRMAYSPVRERVADVILELFEINEKRPELSYSREQLASMVGTAKESLIRTLSDLKSEGLISISGRQIKVEDEAGLAKTAGRH